MKLSLLSFASSFWWPARMRRRCRRHPLPRRRPVEAREGAVFGDEAVAGARMGSLGTAPGVPLI
jgi:hypothetical protein